MLSAIYEVESGMPYSCVWSFEALGDPTMMLCVIHTYDLSRPDQITRDASDGGVAKAVACLYCP